MKTLNDMSIGDTATIDEINVTGVLKRRIIDMGLTKGSRVKIERIAPLGDPIDVKVKNSHVAIRRSDAKNIIVN